MLIEQINELVQILSFLFACLFIQFIILLDSFNPKFNFKKFIILLLIAVFLIPVNFMLSFIFGFGVSAEGAKNLHYYKYAGYFYNIYWIEFIISGYLIYRKRYYLAVIIPKILEIVAAVIFFIIGNPY